MQLRMLESGEGEWKRYAFPVVLTKPSLTSPSMMAHFPSASSACRARIVVSISRP